MNGCDRAASVNCFCCNTNICKRHLTEHIEAVKTQIDPLANESKQMVEKFEDLTIEKITESSFVRLHQWKNDMHQSIDEIFSNKIQEMKDLIDRNKEKFTEFKNHQLQTVLKIEDQVKELIKDGDATFDQIQSLRNHLTNAQTNLTHFENNFLSVHTALVTKQLVTISSNLNPNSCVPTLFASPNHVTVGAFPSYPRVTSTQSPTDRHRSHPTPPTVIFTTPVPIPPTNTNATGKYSLPRFDETKRN